jgi:hypothetical protein
LGAWAQARIPRISAERDIARVKGFIFDLLKWGT